MVGSLFFPARDAMPTDEDVALFCSITNTDESTAVAYLEVFIEEQNYRVFGINVACRPLLATVTPP